ncbi:MAG: response regulator [Nitrospira sp.]|nr:response regulator [Nitrospira sp.]
MKTKILIVEDEPDTALLLTRTLERGGFSIRHASDGRQVSTLIDTTAPPSLVVLDIVIPYVNGFELLDAIRRHPDWHDIPVIMLSADSYEPDIQRALRAGATAYVVKQLGLRALIRAIVQVLPTPVPAAPTPDEAVVKPLNPAVHTREHRYATDGAAAGEK